MHVNLWMVKSSLELMYFYFAVMSPLNKRSYLILSRQTVNKSRNFVVMSCDLRATLLELLYQRKGILEVCLPKVMLFYLLSQVHMGNRDLSHQDWRKNGHVCYGLSRESISDNNFFCLLISDFKIK